VSLHRCLPVQAVILIAHARRLSFWRCCGELTNSG
jgi:hypothetical protein